MTLPWRYRPTDPDSDWANNWLSNAFAWGACTFTPTWCTGDENHWTIKVANYLFADCPCCLAFRCLALGAMVGGIFAAVLATALVYFI